MPELPEVEHFRLLLLPLIASSTSSSSAQHHLSIECPSATPPKSFPSKEELKELNDNNYSVQDVVRKGKLLCLVLTGMKEKGGTIKKKYLFLHMGMTGRISTPNKIPKLESLTSETDYPPPHTHLILRSSSNNKKESNNDDDDSATTDAVEEEAKEASFSDPRRFGSVQISNTLDEQFDTLAPDALTESNAEVVEKQLTNQRRGIKSLLLDQKAVLSGVGNWVADEVLYQSHIHPDQTHLTKDEARKVRKTIQTVLETAVNCLSDEKEFPSDWIFHRRWDKGKKKKKKTKGKKKKKDGDDNDNDDDDDDEEEKSPVNWKGKKVEFVKSGGRTSAIVPSVQKLKRDRDKREKRDKRKMQKKVDDEEEDQQPGSSKGGGSKSKKRKRVKTEDEGATSKETKRKTKKNTTKTTGKMVMPPAGEERKDGTSKLVQKEDDATNGKKTKTTSRRQVKSGSKSSGITGVKKRSVTKR